MLVMGWVLTPDIWLLAMALPLCHALQDQLGVLCDCPLDTIDSLGPVHIGLQIVVNMRVVLS